LPAGADPGLQNRCEQRPCSGGFDSRPPPLSCTHGETSIWLAGHLIDDGVLGSIDNCDRVESLSALPRRLAGVLP
jgi:hypothetical protein